MAYTRTLAQLRTSLLVRGQYEGSSDITPAVALEYLNDALVETYDVFVQRWADYYTQVGSPTITFVVGTDSYAVPGDFYKLRKVEILYSGLATDPNACWKPLYPLDLSGSTRKTAAGLVSKNYRYRLQGGTKPLVFMPVPQAAETVRIWYIPIAPQLASDSDTVQFQVPAEQKLVLNIAYRDCLIREDLDTSNVLAEIDKLTLQLMKAADNRDVAEPFYLSDRNPGYDDEDWL